MPLESVSHCLALGLREEHGAFLLNKLEPSAETTSIGEHSAFIIIITIMA